jgi:hypothetical protein
MSWTPLPTGRDLTVLVEIFVIGLSYDGIALAFIILEASALVSASRADLRNTFWRCYDTRVTSLVTPRRSSYCNYLVNYRD